MFSGLCAAPPPLLFRVPELCDEEVVEAKACWAASSTCCAESCSRQSLLLAMCRSQPSFWQGRQGNGFCTSQTLPRRWTVPEAAHGSDKPPAGHGPHRRGSVGPNSAMVGQPLAAARCVTDVSGPI